MTPLPTPCASRTRRIPSDLDLRYIFAEAILNRTPWRMWDPHTGEPAPGAGTLEAREVLEAAFRDLPGAMDHPGLLHLHVHLMEMSPHPEAALVTGDRLREVSPDMGHLVHMPTHIDIQCGHYRDAMHWNQKAIIADRKFYDRAGPMNFYSGYRVHNYHFAAYGAMFLGQYAPAIAAADELIETMPEAMLRIPSPPMADFFESYVSIRQHVLIRFGKWREIIAQDAAGGPRALLQYRGDDALRQGRRPRRTGRRAARRRPNRRCSAKPRSGCRNPGKSTTCSACSCWPSPRRCWRARSPTAAASTTRPSPVSAPPSRWRTTCPTTSLGAGCSRSATRSARCCWSRAERQEAEAVYREDLGLGGALPRAQIHPDNLWALRGLLDCLERRGETAEAALIRQRVDFAAARADLPVSVSCFCAVGKAA